MTIGNETIQLRLEDRTAWITLDRLPLNILDISMMQALDATLERTLRRENALAFHAVFRRLAATDCLKIAAGHGYCLGGGMELATFCDFVLATESVQFGQPEIKLGCFPPVAMVTLPPLIGMRAAADLILTGHPICAAEALRLGLVTRVVPDAQLPVALNSLLEELQTLSPSVLQLARKTLGRIHFADFPKQLEEVERVYLTELMKTQDAREGILAFLEKRPPIWKGK